jgi:predicted acylesterase/phospholipase RssA
MRIQQKKKLALVLSGGGVKAAAFHIGVILALREKGFKFSGGFHRDPALKFEGQEMTFTLYVGSSAGSVISTFLASGYSVDAIVEAFTKGAGFHASNGLNSQENALSPMSYKDIFALNIQSAHPSRLLAKLFKDRPVLTGGLETLFKKGFKVNGLFSTKNLERYLREKVLTDNSFQALSAELYIVATQLNHSRKVIFGPYPETTKTKSVLYSNFAKVSEAVAASASLPPFFAPTPIRLPSGKEHYFFDGEIRDTLSTHVAADQGADLVISSYSIQPYHYTREMGSLHEYGMPLIFNQALYQLVQQKIERHMQHQSDMRAMIKAVRGYMKQAEIADEHIEKLTEILVQRTNMNPHVDYIYIHPSPMDYEFFFADHFSLNEKVLNRLVKVGFRAAMEVLRHLI